MSCTAGIFRDQRACRKIIWNAFVSAQFSVHEMGMLTKTRVHFTGCCHKKRVILADPRLTK